MNGCDQPTHMRAHAQTDAEWLHELFAVPEQKLAELPEWARPVITPEGP